MARRPTKGARRSGSGGRYQRSRSGTGRSYSRKAKTSARTTSGKRKPAAKRVARARPLDLRITLVNEAPSTVQRPLADGTVLANQVVPVSNRKAKF